MNMPPECDIGKYLEHRLCNGSFWHVLNKTKSTQHTTCRGHIQAAIEEGCTMSIYPARDYSKHANGHDLTADNSQSDHGGINGD